MNDNKLAVIDEKQSAIMEKVIAAGDLSALSVSQRNDYYMAVCKSTGLNPLTRPFEYINLNGKLTLYTRKSATDQLREIYGVSITSIKQEKIDNVLFVTVTASSKDGRTDTDIGAVSLESQDGEWRQSQTGKRYFHKLDKWSPLRGDDLANAIMKAITKGKRRVTLSLCGLGWLDETEIETIPANKVQRVDVAPPPAVVDIAPPVEGEVVDVAPATEETTTPDNADLLSAVDALADNGNVKVGEVFTLLTQARIYNSASHALNAAKGNPDIGGSIEHGGVRITTNEAKNLMSWLMTRKE